MPDNQVPKGGFANTEGGYLTTFSSPHSGGNIVLFADGRVQMISNEWITANPVVWQWEDTTPVNIP